MGELRKRGNVWWLRYYRNGQRIEESAGAGKSHQDAKNLLKDREGEVSKGVPITARSTRLTFDDAAKDVVTDYTVNGKRSKGELERRIALHLTPYFGGRRLSAITTADLRAFVAKRLEAKAAPAEINRELAIVRRAFRLAVADDRHGRTRARPLVSHAASRMTFDGRPFGTWNAAACREASPCSSPGTRPRPSIGATPSRARRTSGKASIG